MASPEGFWGDNGWKRAITQILRACLLASVIFLLLDVASSARALPNHPELHVDSGSSVVLGFRSCGFPGITSERVLLGVETPGDGAPGDKSGVQPGGPPV